MKKEKKKNKKKRGFTLIELLAVIIILGILLILAVPSVTRFVVDSKKNGYVNTAKEIIGGARNLVHNRGLDFSDENATYYMPSTCVKVSNNDRAVSPYGEFDPAYVIINYDSDNESFDYYWMSRDNTGMGVKKPTHVDKLGTSDIESDITREEFNSGMTTVNNSSKFVFFNDDCTSRTEVAASVAGTILPVNECSFDGEMVQGAEFIDGQYTYRYMQSATPTTNLEELWENIDRDGWGVVLTDKTSSDPVNTRICTSINNKPIVSMDFMFYNSNTTSIDVSSFDTSHVIQMQGMFNNVTNIRELDLSTFDTSSLVYHSMMFQGDANLETLNMDNWDMRKNGGNGSHFSGCSKLKTISVRNWKIPQYLTSWLSWSWSGAGSPIETIDVTGWDLSQTKSISGLFGGSSHLKNIIGLDTWDTSNIEDMSTLFTSCSSLTSIDLSHFNTSNVTDMSAMFAECTGLTSLNLSHFDTSKVTNISSMFYGCSNLRNINLNNWDTRNVSETYNMFYNASSLTSLDLSHFRTPNLTNYHSMFEGASNLEELDLSNWDLTNAGVNADVFAGCESLETLTLNNWKIPQSFTNFTSTTGINDLYIYTLNLYNWDLSNTTDLSSLFYGAINLSNIYGLPTWDTSNIQDMSYMFMFAGQYVFSFSANVSGWNTGNVTDMSYMFSYSGQQANNWNVGSLSSWNVSNVENMTSMFDGTASHVGVFNIGDLSGWDTRKVTSMFAMFYSAGQGSGDWYNIGTFKIYGGNTYAMFSYSYGARGTINIYSNPYSYDNMFYATATSPVSGIYVNYTSDVTDIDNIIATKYASSRVYKGNLIS